MPYIYKDIPIISSDVPPEGNVQAEPNTQCNHDGEIWIKRSGTGTEGWVKYSVSGGGSDEIVATTQVDLNTTGDQSLTVTPTKYRITKVVFSEPSTNLSSLLTTLTTQIWTGSGGTGQQVISDIPRTLLEGTSAIANASLHTDISNTLLTTGTLYFRVTNTFGSAATIDLTILGESY